jgi:drug/metabolite transporter (DMT)-like permease
MASARPASQTRMRPHGRSSQRPRWRMAPMLSRVRSLGPLLASKVMSRSQPDLTSTLVHRSRGVAALSLVTVIWGMVPLVFKETDMPILSFATYRLWMGVLIYVVVFAFTGRRVSWATIKVCALGGVFFACDVALSFAAFRLTSVANATIIGALAPVFITLGAARWFGERVQRRDLIMVGASFFGVALVALGSRDSPSWSPLGDAFALASVVSWTCYWLFSKRTRTSSSTPVGALEYMASVMTVAAVVMTGLALAFGQSLALPTKADWGWIWLVAIFPGFIGHSLVSWSHRHVEAWLGSLITQCQPVVATAAGALLLDERPGPVTIVGMLVVVFATGVIIASSRRRGRDAAQAFDEPETPAPAG